MWDDRRRYRRFIQAKFVGKAILIEMKLRRDRLRLDQGMVSFTLLQQ